MFIAILSLSTSSSYPLIVRLFLPRTGIKNIGATSDFLEFLGAKLIKPKLKYKLFDPVSSMEEAPCLNNTFKF